MTGRAEITFSEEQAQILDLARNFCSEKAPVAGMRAQLTGKTGFSRQVWDEMAALGWLGTAVPEEFGGCGLSMAEVTPLVESMGRYLMAGPFISTTLAALALVHGGTQEQQGEWLPKICNGAIGALALAEPGEWNPGRPACTGRITGGKIRLAGTKTLVTDAPVADLVLVSVSIDGEPSLVLLSPRSLKPGALQRETVIDETRRSYRLSLDGISVPVTNLLDRSKSTAALREMELGACLLLAAEMCGGMAAILDLMVEYLNKRKQFGKAIGSYQALKHPTVEALNGLEAARSHLYHAATRFGAGEDAEVAARMAKVQAAQSFIFAGDRAIQFHGGFGFTYDCDAQLFLRRALWCESQYGDSRHHRKILGDLIFGKDTDN